MPEIERVRDDHSPPCFPKFRLFSNVRSASRVGFLLSATMCIDGDVRVDDIRGRLPGSSVPARFIPSRSYFPK